jgi:hypothetical protein
MKTYALLLTAVVIVEAMLDSGVAVIASTPEERTHAVEIARKLEKQPLGKRASEQRAEMVRWLMNDSGLGLHWCTGILLDFESSDKELAQAIIVQAFISGGAFGAEHPNQAGDLRAVAFAGVQGAIRAYQSVLKRDESKRHEFMDRLVRLMNEDRLNEYIDPVLTKSCK